MAKKSGLAHALYVAGYDFSGDITAIGNVSGGPTALRGCTGIDKSAMEAIGGTRDGHLEASSWFNPAANMNHKRYSLLPTADVIATYCLGTALGDEAAAVNGKQLNYDGTRGNDGSFTFNVSTVGNGSGVEWCRQLTAGKRTDGSAANGTGVDFAVASAFGLQAYLQVFAFTGTSVTVKLQESSDDAGDAYADVVGGGFTAATGITFQRIETTRTLAVERYLRVVTTGTFTNAVFNVVVQKNLTSTLF